MFKTSKIITGLALAASITVSAAQEGAAKTKGPAEETSATEPAKADGAKFDTLAKKIGYSIGTQIGGQVKNVANDLDLDSLIAGLRDAVAGKAPQLDEAAMRKAMGEFQTAQMLKQNPELAKTYNDNLNRGKEFLKQNGKREGVVTLPSGLQYEVLKAGTGAKPKPTDVIKANYKGTVIDGTVFDSSEGKPPLEMQLNGLIPGWIEAFQLMPVGSKWKLFIPADLAYGAQQRGETITPGSTLIFEVELLDIVRSDSK